MTSSNDIYALNYVVALRLTAYRVGEKMCRYLQSCRTTNYLSISEDHGSFYSKKTNLALKICFTEISPAVLKLLVVFFEASFWKPFEVPFLTALVLFALLSFSPQKIMVANGS